jgi:hypothetical protein|tara:strand:- start:1745 stop:3076 length:1332 start_codon:yes stop_codon:yes gene_type:complete
MFLGDDIPISKKKVGFYELHGKQYGNKFHALSHCKNGEYPKFNFNEEAFGKADFTVNPSESIYELYKKRALQLRKDYDYLVVYFSGGIDSAIIIRTFLENKIKIDGVIVYGTWSLDGKLPDGMPNYNTLEQSRAGMPFLKQMEKEYNVKLNICMYDAVESFYNFKDENYVWSLGGNTVGPRMYSWNFVWQNKWMQQFLMKGKVASIKGIDKPRVYIEDGKWYFGFLDTNVNDGTPTGELHARQDWDIHEYFYWTPDMPELVIKQAHIVIDYLEKNVPIDVLKRISTKDASFDRKTYIDYVDPLIYSNNGRWLTQDIGKPKNYFGLSKPLSAGLVQKDLWFHQLGDDETKQQFDVWLAGINLLQSKIDPMYFNQSRLESVDEKVYGKVASNAEFDARWNTIVGEYNLQKMIQPKDKDDRHIIWGPVGIWSTPYFVKNSKHVFNN